METLNPVKYTNINDVDAFNLQNTTDNPSNMNVSKVFNDSLVFRNFYRNIKIKMNNVIFNGKSRIIKLGNDYEFKLSKSHVKFKLLTMGDIEAIERIILKEKEDGVPVNNQTIYFMEKMIVQANGSRDKGYIKELIRKDIERQS
jgi:hypothetical protein